MDIMRTISDTFNFPVMDPIQPVALRPVTPGIHPEHPNPA